jgi:transcriptional regulator with XRE-family HTH domain
MTLNEHSAPKRNVYDMCDPQYLRQLREAAGMDMLVLARTACLSVAQVRQLESGSSDSLFYSDAIKRQAYKRLLMVLGAEPPSVEVPQDLRDACKVAEAHLNTLDQIVAMSNQPTLDRSTSDVAAAAIAKLKEHKQVLGALLLLLLAVVLFVLNDPLGKETLTATPLPSVSSVASTKSVELPVVATPALVVASEPVSVPASAVVVSGASVNRADACAYSDDAMPQLTSLFAQKEGRYVYVVSTSNTELCVVDGNKQATLLQLKAGENRSVYGVSPWQLSGPGLHKVQIYFQGGRLTLPDATVNRFKLVEVPVVR